MDNELQIAMSPVHLAAVISDKSVTESEGMSNRLMGGLTCSWEVWNWLVQQYCAWHQNPLG
uniref:hypothetical protein n=1 Tax=Candidatus Pantoea varia TaxID=1881036 RepID=UPI0026A92E22